MKVQLDNNIYLAKFRHRSGRLCLGYGDTIYEAVSNCWHLVAEADKRQSCG